jgi:Cd2+/Zn2+-exporting ATPase
VIALNGHTEEELLEIASALEKPSEHPLARAILKEAIHRGIEVEGAKEFQIHKGLGAEGRFKEQWYWIGSHRFMHQQGQETEEEHRLTGELEDAGHSVIAIGDGKHICGLISVADAPRPLIKETLAAIRGLGVKKILMLTGDNLPTATALAKIADIKDFRAELLPEDKVEAIKALKEQHRAVAMVGDGVNDAPAMATAHLGIAMGAMGTDAAFETADVVLMGDDLALIPQLIRHSRRTLSIIKQNIIFALSLKLVFIVLATFGLASLWMAIAADTGATLLVIFNGLRLLSYGNTR